MELSSRPVIILEVKSENFTYSFNLPIGAPFQESYDAAVQVANEIVKLAQNASEQMKAAQEQSDKNQAPQ